MPESNFNLRDIPPDLILLLKREAKRLHTSINTLVLKIIERELGFTCEKHTHHDLDHLAGSWSTAEEKTFKENTQFFEQIEKKPLN